MKTIVQHLEAYDRRRAKEKLKAATKHLLVGLGTGFILGMILRGFI